MKEGCGMRDGSTRGAAPGADAGPVRARALSDERKRGGQLRYYAHGIILSVQAAPNSTQGDRVTEK